jgi:alkylation response protein AidB-like acyl-CoA dehydrogenase
MDYDLSKPQKLLQEAVGTFVARECPLTRVRELIDRDSNGSESTLEADLWQSIADQGWIGLHLPEQLGGLDLTVVELAVVGEKLGQGCVPGPFLSTNWAATLLAASSNDELARQVVPKMAEGSSRAAVAMLGDELNWSEPAASLKIRGSGDGLCLDGKKTVVMDAAGADVFVCVGGTANGAAIAVVPAGTEGVTIEATAGMDGTRPLSDVRFEGVRISSAQVVADGVDAERAIRRANHVAATLAAAELCGAAQWMLDTTVEYAKTRKQFDKVIGSFQAVQHQCADMLLMTESSRSAVYYAAWALSVDDPASAAAVSIAKAYCSDAAREVGNHAIQCHGGIGFTWEHDLHFFYKRARAAEYLLGDATYHREELAKLVLDAQSEA